MDTKSDFIVSKVKKKNIIYYLAAFLFILALILSYYFRPNVTIPNERARRIACYDNLRLLQGAVQIYNVNNADLMKSLDIDLLVKYHYLKKNVSHPESDCEYLSDGDLTTKNGKIFCKRHGSLDIDDIKIEIEEEQEKSYLMKEKILYYLIFFTICLTPSFAYVIYAKNNNSEAYGCFIVLLIIIIISSVKLGFLAAFLHIF